MVKEKRLGQLILAAMLVGYLLYAAVFIFQSSFVINGTRYFVLFDDAMISMQYARNFAHGQGLVWNAWGAWDCWLVCCWRARSSGCCITGMCARTRII